MNFGKVAVLMGGRSSEREISLKSGQAVLNSLLEQGIDAHGIDAIHGYIDELKQGQFDRVFNVLHGPVGEDGTIQALLEQMNIPYTGSRVGACVLAMDKAITKKIWQAHNLPTPNFKILDTNQPPEQALYDLNLPFVIKPLNEGSSIGITKINHSDEIEKAIKEAKKYGTLMAEEWISGREFTVGIVGNQVLPSIQIDTPREFYDFEAKYLSNDTQYHCPSGLTEAQESQIQDIALKAFDTLGCSGWGRVDLMQDESGHFQLIELNPIPGMTETSLIPKAAGVHGWDFNKLTIKILQGCH